MKFNYDVIKVNRSCYYKIGYTHLYMTIIIKDFGHEIKNKIVTVGDYKYDNYFGFSYKNKLIYSKDIGDIFYSEGNR